MQSRPKAKARASGSEREMGRDFSSERATISHSELKQAKYPKAHEQEVTAHLSPFGLTDEKYCILFSPKAFCDTQKMLKKRLRPELRPGLVWGS